MYEEVRRAVESTSTEVLQRQWQERRERIMVALKDITGEMAIQSAESRMPQFSKESRASAKNCLKLLTEVRERLVTYVTFRDRNTQTQPQSKPSPVS